MKMILSNARRKIIRNCWPWAWFSWGLSFDLFTWVSRRRNHLKQPEVSTLSRHLKVFSYKGSSSPCPPSLHGPSLNGEVMMRVFVPSQDLECSSMHTLTCSSHSMPWPYSLVVLDTHHPPILPCNSGRCDPDMSSNIEATTGAQLEGQEKLESEAFSLLLVHDGREKVTEWCPLFL